jgi:hypothetical protein
MVGNQFRFRKGSALQEFRYYCLSGSDHIILGDNLFVPNLDAAIRAAYEACRDHPHYPSSRIEIWQGARRLYATNHHCDGSDACETGDRLTN